MPNPNAVVSRVIRLDPPLDRPVDDVLRAEGGLWVELDGERRLRLDPQDSRSSGFAQVFDGLRRQNLPGYIEFDPDTSAVTGIRIPYLSPVLGIRTVDRGVFDVVLANSHARHFLRAGGEDFEALRERLDEAVRTGAPVIVVDDDAHDIIDVQFVPPGPEEPRPPFPDRPPRPRWPWRWIEEIRDTVRRWYWWYWWPWWWFRCISAGRAQQVFDDMSATSCTPLTVPAPCIPFMYPDDGCWARASEMCRLMALQGLKPRKVWICGSLHVATRNNPTCGVMWGWHVAPTLCVHGPKLCQRQRMVIDPSLFTTPVTQAQWKGVQGDPLASLTDTDASIFWYFSSPTGTDPTYAQTNYYLAYYRLALQNRSVNLGPPPYANCP
jgi:hypothetical protein